MSTPQGPLPLLGGHPPAGIARQSPIEARLENLERKLEWLRDAQQADYAAGKGTQQTIQALFQGTAS